MMFLSTIDCKTSGSNDMWKFYRCSEALSFQSEGFPQVCAALGTRGAFIPLMPKLCKKRRKHFYRRTGQGTMGEMGWECGL